MGGGGNHVSSKNQLPTTLTSDCCNILLLLNLLPALDAPWQHTKKLQDASLLNSATDEQLVQGIGEHVHSCLHLVRVCKVAKDVDLSKTKVCISLAAAWDF